MSGAIVTPDDLGRHLDGVPIHAVRLLSGSHIDGLVDRMAIGDQPVRPIVRLGATTYAHDGASEIVRDAVRDLGRMVETRWPYLWGEDLSEVRDEPLSRAHLAVRLTRLADRLQGLSAAWATEASLRLARGRGPCASQTQPTLAWAQLVLALSPGGLTLVAPLPERAPAAALAALEWLADAGTVAVVLLAPVLPPSGGPYDRVLFGARELTCQATAFPDPEHGPAEMLADVEVEGRPHPNSPAERRLYELIRADAELGPLFGFNRIAPEVTRAQARVDILWPEGRVAVEVDGPEHRGPARYRADRHRDYELLCAGYRVLRLTNEEVTEDAGLALAKIRDVVRLRRIEGP